MRRLPQPLRDQYVSKYTPSHRGLSTAPLGVVRSVYVKMWRTLSAKIRVVPAGQGRRGVGGPRGYPPGDPPHNSCRLCRQGQSKWRPGMLRELWGRPPGLRGTPPSRSSLEESRPFCNRDRPTRASADPEGTPQGVRPTINAGVRSRKKYVTLRCERAPQRDRRCRAEVTL